MNKKKLLSLFMAFVMSLSIVAQAALPVMAADENLGDSGEEIVEVMDNGDETINETENEETLQTMDVDPGGTFGNGFSWQLLGNTLTIDGNGDMPDYEFLGYGDGDLIITEAPWFDYNEQIEEVVFGQGVTSVGAYAFAGYPNITTIGLHEGLKSIGESAFMLYQGTELNLPSTLEYLDYDAFLFATNVETLHIPANLEYIGYGALSHMDSLTEITADPNNSSYTAEGGVLYSKDGMELVLYPCGNGEENVVVPEGVSVIGNGAFWGKWMMQSVSLPSTLTVIDSGAFQVCMGLTEITIPEGVTYIGSYAFNSCDNLKTVNLPLSIAEIKDDAFARCAQLTTVNYAGEIDDWNSIDIGAGNDYLVNAYLGGGESTVTSGQCGENVYWEFENGTITITGTGPMYEDWGYTPPWLHLQNQIEHLVVEEGVTTITDFSYFDVLDADLPEGLVYIGRDAFCGFRGTSITLPSTLETIYESAFCDAHNLTSIHLPAKVETVDATSFCRNYSLTQITVDTNNPYYKSVDGVLYTNNGTQLVVVPAGKTGTSYTVENGTEIINSNGLAYCTFENVVLPDTVTTIGTLVFRGCENLETVTIPAGITTIKSRAFRDCDNLTRVNFKGTEAQWENILANTKSDNNPLLLATTYLSDNSVYEYKNVPVTFHHHNGEITVGFYKYMPLTIGGVGGSTAPTGGGIELWFTDPELTQEWDMDRDIITGPINLYSNTYVESAPSDEFTWHYDEDTYTLYINGSGDMPEYGQFGAPWYEEYQYKCTNLVIGSGITSISDYAFYNMMVNKVTLPEGLLSIGRDAFMAGANVTGGMNIPSTLVDIHPTAIVEIEGELTVSPDNPVFTYEDGMLFAQDDLFGKALHCVTLAADEELVIPSDVEYIIELAAAYNYKLKKVTIPASVTEIQGRAFFSCLYLEEAVVLGNVNRLYYSTFSNCPNLKKVVLPASITKINNFVFDDTHEDLTIYFMGTEAQWNAIDVNMSQNTGLAEADIVFDYEYSVPANGTLTDTINWSLVDGVLTLTGTGATPDYEYGATNRPWQDYISNIKKIVVGEGITNIGKTTFKNVVNLEEVSLPSTLKTIGKYGFYNCRNLKTINLPEGLTSLDYQCFHQCASLEEVVIPASVTVIPEYAFYECNNIHIKLHSGITEIGNYAFWESYNGVIEFIGTEEQWDAITKGNSAIGSRVTIVFSAPKEGPLTETINWALVDGVLTISGSGAMPDYDDWKVTPWYDHRDNVTSIVIGDGITYVGKRSFVGFNYVESLSLPEGLESIGSMAFASYKGSELILPSTLKTAGNDAFATSHNITTLHIPAAYESGVAEVFGGCAGIEEFTVDEDHPLYKTIDGVLYSKDGTVLELYPIAKGTTFTVPEGVTTIGQLAFWQSFLTEIILPSTLTTLEEAAFYVCQNLKTIFIPDGVTTIPDRCFSDASVLETVFLPDSIEAIGWRAFGECNSLGVVYYGSGEYSWDEIVIEDGNEALENAEIIYYVYIYDIKINQPEHGEIQTSLEGDWYIEGQPFNVWVVPEEGYRILEFGYIESPGESWAETVYIDGDYATVDTWGELEFFATLEPIVLGEGQLTDDISWIVENRQLRIMGNGHMPDFASKLEQPWYQLAINGLIESIHVDEGIEHIGAYAFESIVGAEELFLPDSVVSVGERAFAGMQDMTDILYLPFNINYIGPEAFYSTEVGELQLPDNLQVIHTGAFTGAAVKVLYIPQSVELIEDGAFENFIGNSVVYYGSQEEWENCVSIGEYNEGLTNLAFTFEGQPAEIGGMLTETISWYLDLDKRELVVEGEGAMPDYNSGLDTPWRNFEVLIERVKVGEGVTRIGNRAFSDLLKLERVRIFDDVQTIGEYAFADSSVRLLTFADSVKTIEAYAFNNTNVNEDDFFFAGFRDAFYEIDIEDEGNDNMPWPQHINAQKNVDWVEVNFETGPHYRAIDPITVVEGYNINVEWDDRVQVYRDGYVMSGWYYNSKYIGMPYSWHSDLFWEDTTLYAKWEKQANTDSDLPDDSKVTGITLYDDYGNKLSSSKTINFYNEGYFYLIWPEVLGTGEFDDQLTVTSSNEAVAMFDPFHEGYAYAFFIGKAGTAKLTFTSKQNPKVKTTLTLNVKAKANEAQLTVSKNETNDGAQLLTVGQTVTPSIQWIGGEAWAKGTYEIAVPEDNGVLEMVSGGKIKAVAPGDCHVMLYGWDEESGRNIWTETWVTVYAEKVKEVKLSNSTIILDSNSLEPMYSYRQIRYIDVEASNVNYEDGHTGAYNEFDITWTASNNIVVVNGEDEIVESGTVGNRVGFYAVNNDKASITVTFKAKDGSGKSAKATVKTGTAVEDIDLTLPSERYDEDYGTVVTVAKGKSVKAVANVIPASATLKTLAWTAEEIIFDEEGNWVESKPTDIVTVSNGTIKGVKPGMAFVTVRATDGSYWVNHGFWVEVTEAVTGVQIDDAAKTVVRSRHDGPATFEPQINLTYADGTTAPAGDKVKITVAGTNGKYVSYGYNNDEGSWFFEVDRPGKYTIKAAAVDGSGKSATVTVDVQQHVYYFDAAAPKNTPTNGDEWVVKAGTTVTPQVVYNFGEKLNTPASAFKKYTIEVSEFQPDDPSLTASQCYSQNTAKSNIKVLKAGIYTLTIAAVDCGCSEQEHTLPESRTIRLRVIPKNSVDLSNVELRTTVGYANNNGDINLAKGVSAQFTAYGGGVKLSNVTTKWRVFEDESGNEMTGMISTSGKLNLTNAEEGKKYVIECTITDKSNPANDVVTAQGVRVLKRLTPADIQLLNSDSETPVVDKTDITTEYQLVRHSVPLVEGATENFTFKTSSAKIVDAIAELEGYELNGHEVLLSANGVGTATITVTANDGSGVKRTFKVKVNKEDVPVKAIVPSAKTFTVNKGEPFTFWYDLTPAVAGQQVSNPEIQWTVSDERVAEVVPLYEEEYLPWTDLDVAGVVGVVPLATGKVTITGKALDGSNKTVKITVNIVDPSAKQTVNYLDLSLPANTPSDGLLNRPVITWGKSLTLKATTIPVKAKNPNILWMVEAYNPETDEWSPDVPGVTIKNGKVTVAKATDKLTPYEGWICVTAYTAFGSEYEGFQPIVTDQYIYVKAPVDKVAVTNAGSMFPGEEKSLAAEFTFNKYDITPLDEEYPIFWSVNNTKLAEIDENGVLTIKEDAKVGSTVKVTAATQDGSGKKVTVSIKIVKKPAVEISVNWMPQELVDLTEDAVEGEYMPITEDCYYYVHHDYDVQNIVFTANRDVPGFNVFEMGYDSYENCLYEGWTFCEDFPLTNKTSLAMRTYLGETVPLIGYSYIDEATDERVYFYMNIHGNTGEIMPRQFVPGEEWL